MRLRLLLPALLLLPGLAGCGLHPIYARSEQQKVMPALAAIAVGPDSGSRGAYFRNYMIDELNPDGLTVPPTFDLDVTLRQQDNSLAIQLDNSATRYNMILGASFTLKRRSDGEVVYSSATRRVVSYNVRSDPFATLVAEQDAQRRAAHEVARQIRTMLALYFSEHPA
ncbi:MAG: LPS assembly lipoprotein LptE [Geminicoccaceae bacterium]